MQKSAIIECAAISYNSPTCLLLPLFAKYNDPISPIEELNHFQRELDQAKVDWQSHVYGNTVHAFTNPKANDPDSGILYHPTHAEHAWEEVEKFLQKSFFFSEKFKS